MGKSLKGKELGKGITQRKDGLYQARFTDRFGKRRTIYAKKYTEITNRLREEQFLNNTQRNTQENNLTLDQWFQKWISIYKKNCRKNSIQTYTTRYNRVQKTLGWRKLSQLNLMVMQEALNDLKTDGQRRDTKSVLVGLLKCAVDNELISKNYAKQLNTVVTQDKIQPRQALTKKEVEIFLEASKNRSHHQLFVLALETGMRIGELTALTWSDIDFVNNVIHVKHSLCYFLRDGRYRFELHDTKTDAGERDIPLTRTAIDALKKQYNIKQIILKRHKEPLEGYENLVFVSRNNTPLTDSAINLLIRKIVKQIRNDNPNLDFPDVSPHIFRHTYATRCIEAGVQPKTLQRILGHSRLQFTMDLYCHTTIDSIKEAGQTYENYMSENGVVMV